MTEAVRSAYVRIMFSVVVAVDEAFGIGKDGGLPQWKIPKDMQYFKQLTTSTSDPLKRNAVVMGKKTWLSIPEKFRPLPGRLNIVISRTLQKKDLSSSADVAVAVSPSEAVRLASSFADVERIFVIGGGQIYQEYMSLPNCERLYVTHVEQNFNCDTHFPRIDSAHWVVEKSSELFEENSFKFRFVRYVRPETKALPVAIQSRHEEFQYLDLISEIITKGKAKGDRTGTGTLSLFGRVMRFDVSSSFPLLTTKKVFWRGVAEELLWFISGCTDASVLQKKGIHIWDGNSTRAYLDSIGLQQREEGDLGPVYGFQWRHFGAEYKDRHTDYSGKGIDQLKNCIETIKKNPNDRRIIMSAWNPSDLRLMALPPCHMFCQFVVTHEKSLSCLMYQRSADMGLGVPFNIASYALLLRLVAQVTNMQAGELVHVMGDCHVYQNHVDALKLQLKNVPPRPFPQLKIIPTITDIDQFKFEHFELVGYDPYPAIKMDMNV